MAGIEQINWVLSDDVPEGEELVVSYNDQGDVLDAAKITGFATDPSHYPPEIERVHGDDVGQDGPVVYGVVGARDPWTTALQYVHHSDPENAKSTVRWADKAFPNHAPHRIVAVRLSLVEDGV